MFENVDEVGNLLLELSHLVLDLDALESGQLSESHLDYRLRLNLIETEAVHERFASLGDAVRCAQDSYDLVDEIECCEQALKDMGALLSFFQIVPCAAGDYLALVVDILLKNLLKGEYLRLAVYEGEHNHAEGRLELSVGIELIQNYLRIRVALQGDVDVHTGARGIIVDIGYALDALILDEIRHALYELRLVDAVGYLGDNYLVAVALCLDYLGAGTDYNFAAACAVGGAYARSAHDYSAGREIGAWQMSHKLLESRVGVIYQAVHGGYDLAQIVRRDICRHADRYADRAVYKQIRISRREHRGLLESVVVVRDKIDRVLVDIRQHFERELFEL